jgi:hypothetical protein
LNVHVDLSHLPETETEESDFDGFGASRSDRRQHQQRGDQAAFLAAQAGTPVTMPLVLEAARTEFLKLKRPLSEADFQWSEPTIEAEARAGAAG